jgi:cytochrome c-type biogenesis protein CcmE
MAGLLVAGGLGYLTFQGLSNATVYFRTADQAVAERAHLGARTFRVEGTVVNDVMREADATRFDIYANGVTVAVVDVKQPPQLFRPGVPVVLEGHWSGAVYEADVVMVKHTASYAEAHPERLKPQAPPAGSP